MIAIIDFGGQYCHLIARRIRELGVLSQIYTHDVKSLPIVEGIILSGGPDSVTRKGAPLLDESILKMKVPILGICYGHQLLAHQLGGVVENPVGKEYGRSFLKIKNNGRILKGISNSEVWMSHGIKVINPPNGCKTIASTESCQIAAFEGDNIFGVQFHPEVNHTKFGKKILDNFLNICKAKRNWDAKDRIDSIVTSIKSKIGDKGVIMGVSGGVDSLVALALIRKATDNVFCVSVDHGLCRIGDMEHVKEIFDKLKISEYRIVDASKMFLSRLKGITDPEQKRKIIGNTFIEIFDSEVAKKNISFLGQGTIYPDRIESAQPSKTANVIKTHHNVGGLPKKMKLGLIEPLAEFYKDEVREIGVQLGLPVSWLNRHPFPGPGLAIRIIGEVTPEKVEILRKADAIFTFELIKSKNYDKTWQALCALLPVKSVGVMGDSRTYANMISIRAVTSEDAMTADWAKLPYDLLDLVSRRIVNEVAGVNRVVYDITSKPPATIEYE